VIEAAAIGDAVPPFTVAITLQRLVMEAGANRDFAQIHHDPAVALASGAPAVYANTTFVETLLEAALRTWTGPEARLTELEFSMTDFICVGDTVSAAGTVSETDGRTVRVDLWIDGERSRLVTGAATVELA
jgi:acyl dehydratase